MDEYVGELPDDVIIDILCCLPAKSLAKCKLLSTSWYWVISNLCLRKISPPCATAPLSGYLFFTGTVYSLSLRFIGDNSGREHWPSDYDMSFLNSYSPYLPYDPKQLLFQDCCNGMVLLARSSVVPTEYFVFNPTTRECLPLPLNPRHDNSGDNGTVLRFIKALIPHGLSGRFSASLAFDPADSLSYRVVLFNRLPLMATALRPPVIHVFCSESDEWSSHDIPLDPAVYGFDGLHRFFYMDGILYGLSDAKFLICINLRVICSWGKLSLDPKAAYVLPLPAKDEVDRHGFLGTSSGYVHYSNYIGSMLKFWYLDKGVEWVLKLSINAHELDFHPSLRGVMRPFSFTNHSGKLWVFALHPHNSDEVIMGTVHFMVRYNLQTRHMEVIHKITGMEGIDETRQPVLLYRGIYHVYPYSQCPLIFNSLR